MYKSDIKRKEIISNAIENPNQNRESNYTATKMVGEGRPVIVTHNPRENAYVYRELLNDSFWKGLYSKSENKNKTNIEAITTFISERLVPIFAEFGLHLESYTYQNKVLKVLFYETNNDLDEIYNAIDEGQFLNALREKGFESPNDDKKRVTRYDKIKASVDNTNRSSNPKRVDMLLKTTLSDKFEGNYKLNTDTGIWRPTKSKVSNGKLLIFWEHDKVSLYEIQTLLFPEDTNTILVKVFDKSGKLMKSRDIEIYKIPVNTEEIEDFYRKIFFNELKRYINNEVIKLQPFNEDFVFWDAENPDYPYSFSTPSRNKIILDLIHFVNISTDPKLNDFFQQNNLKHKQGYLQKLLDSAEDAGIFKFYRKGNEIYVERGANYRDFLQGKIRKV